METHICVHFVTFLDHVIIGFSEASGEGFGLLCPGLCPGLCLLCLLFLVAPFVFFYLSLSFVLFFLCSIASDAGVAGFVISFFSPAISTLTAASNRTRLRLIFSFLSHFLAPLSSVLALAIARQRRQWCQSSTTSTRNVVPSGIYHNCGTAEKLEINCG